MENEKLDVKGQACPMPVALTKRKLESIKPGQVLEVKGDCGPGFENLQKWVKNAGYEIVDTSKSETEFIVKIKKP